jgi:hypothetical protein
MKKVFLLILILLLLIFCAPKQDEVERIMEDGVEVVINHLEPYKIPGEPEALTLEEEFRIDTERDEVAEMGLTDIGHYFDIDSEGSIYLVSPKSKKDVIFKFDKTGKFVTSFARWGQGPGEIVSRPFPPLFITINSYDEIVVTNFYRRKLAYFSKGGDFLREKKLESSLPVISPLQNGNWLVYGRPKGQFSMRQGIPLNVCDKEFNVIKELGLRKVPNEFEEEKIKGIHYTFAWALSGEKIYVGKQEEGYIINVYDLEGNLIRRIKKEFKPVPLTESYKKAYKKMYESDKEFLDKLYFPQNFPPFHYFFTDDEGRLFVMTYEKGEYPGEYMYDIFNKDGIFVGRKSMRIYNNPDGLFAIMKRGHFYSVLEKQSYFKELVDYTMNWK